MYIPEEFHDDREAAIDAIVRALQASAPKRNSDGIGVNIENIIVSDEIVVELEVTTRDIDEADFTFDEHSALELREDEEVATEVAESIFDQIEGGIYDEPLGDYLDEDED
jgi:hypothetical protein